MTSEDTIRELTEALQASTKQVGALSNRVAKLERSIAVIKEGIKKAMKTVSILLLSSICGFAQAPPPPAPAVITDGHISQPVSPAFADIAATAARTLTVFARIANGDPSATYSVNMTVKSLKSSYTYSGQITPANQCLNMTIVMQPGDAPDPAVPPVVTAYVPIGTPVFVQVVVN